ncbi:MAG: hypothetical protein EOQ56_30765 [Mesorhizobium sp.]|nr:MAG: hypothetical protein EOQ56_30765 [Mesorhizobium sp.]
MAADMEAAERLHRVAHAIAAQQSVDRDEAVWLMVVFRELVGEDSAPDPRYMRRAALRRIWWKFYPGMARTTAARLLAVEWRRSVSVKDPLPGTIAECFQRLGRAKIRPVGERQIMDDLDLEL